MSDDYRYDDAYRCGYCQGRVYLHGTTTMHYRCAGCGLAPISLIQPNVEGTHCTVELSSSELALLYSVAVDQQNEYDRYSPVIKNKWQEIIRKLSKALSEPQLEGEK